MSTLGQYPSSARVQAIIRQAEAERSVYIGELIGSALIAASNGVKALGAWIRRAVPHALHPN